MKALNNISLPVDISLPESGKSLVFNPGIVISHLKEKIMRLFGSYKNADIDKSLRDMERFKKFELPEKSLYIYKIMQPFL